MYRYKKPSKSMLKSVETTEGETIEQKIERIVENKEPIKDGAPEIYTERKDGVVSAYNIRTDRWEIAADAMDAVQKSIAAKREQRLNPDKKVENKKEGKVEAKTPESSVASDSEAKPVQGKTE